MTSVAPLPGIEGIDVSAYQADYHGRSLVRWREARAAGRLWMAARATVGTVVDRSYESHHRGAREAGLLVGAYHAAAPSGDPIRQAYTYLSTTQFVDLPPILDIETGMIGAVNPSGLLASELRRWCESWIEAVESVTCTRVVVYSYPNFLEMLNVPAGSVLAERELWIAHYGASQPKIPRPWTSAVAWQYLADPMPGAPAGRCPGYDAPPGRGIDCNVFFGDEAALLGWRERNAIERIPDTLPEGAPGPHTKPVEWPTVEMQLADIRAQKPYNDRD